MRIHAAVGTFTILALAGCAGPRGAGKDATRAVAGNWVLLGQATPVIVESDTFSPPSDCINIAGFANETHGIAVCFPAHILVSDDGGERWRQSRMPLTNASFNSLEILGANSWTSTSNLLRVSSDSGETWRELPDYGPIYSGSNFLSFLTHEIGWYCQGLDHGTTPLLSATRDGGVSWRPVPVPPDAENEAMAVSLVSESTGYVLLRPGVLLRTDDGGASWTRLSIPLGDRRPVSENLGAPVYALRFSDPRHGTAVLYMEKPRGFVVFDTSDGGKTWSDQELPAGARPSVGNIFLSHDRRYLTVTDFGTGKILRYRRGE